MSRITVEANLNTSQFTSGLKDMKAQVAEFSKEVGEGAFGRKAIGMISGGLGVAGAGLAVLRMAGAVWDDINEKAGKYYSTQDAILKKQYEQHADLAEAVGVFGTLSKLAADVAASLLAPITKGLRFFKELEAQYKRIGDLAMQEVAIRKKVAKELDEIQQKSDAMDRKSLSGSSAAERLTNLESERAFLQEKLEKTTGFIDRAKLELQLKENFLEITRTQKEYEEQLGQIREKNNERIAKGTELIENNRQKVADAITTLSEKLAQARSGTTVASGMLSKGISLGGERVITMRNDEQIRKLQTQIEHLQRISTNTNNLANLKEADFSVR